MAISKATGTTRRSQDFPNVGDYSYKELNDVYEYYEKNRSRKGSVKAVDIQEKFQCSTDKARVMLAAAEFKYKLKKKGII